MLSINLQARIFRDYHAGKEYTDGKKYRYSIQYNPVSAMHTWIIRQDKNGGEWQFCSRLQTICSLRRARPKYKEGLHYEKVFYHSRQFC